MVKNNKIYHIVSIYSFVLHICVFAFVVIVAFLPFQKEHNFYEVFDGFFGDRLSAIQPYAVMTVLLLSCVGAFLAIKKPLYSFMIAACSASFFVIAALPCALEAMMVGFMSPWLDVSMPVYGIGYQLISAASYICCLDVVFVIYTIVTLISGAKRF